jgi:UDPglucose--hexose-1-phosphate uridylyltransferase
VSELRIDPVSGHRVIITNRYGGGLAGPPPDQALPLEPPFAPVLTAGDGAGPGAPLEGVRADREADLFWAAQAAGDHEPIPAAGELPEALERWRERMRAHAGCACLHLTADGATLPAAELYALPFVPNEIARERERFGAYATRTMGGNLLGDVLQEEVRKRERIVAIDPEAVLVAPFASRVPFQLMLIPRRPRARFEDDGPTGAALLDDALARLERRLGARPPLNLWVRTAPSGAEHFCWRIDLLPRLARRSGLELGAGLPVNPVAPEIAAAELRDA